MSSHSGLLTGLLQAIYPSLEKLTHRRKITKLSLTYFASLYENMLSEKLAAFGWLGPADMFNGPQVALKLKTEV